MIKHTIPFEVTFQNGQKVVVLGKTFHEATKAVPKKWSKKYQVMSIRWLNEYNRAFVRSE